MRRIAAVMLLVGLSAGAGVSAVRAADAPREPLADKVRKAIEDGKKFLIDSQRMEGDGKGSWELYTISEHHRGGTTSLAILALLNAGEKPDSPVIQRTLKYLRDVETTTTYSVGLQTLALAEVGQDQDKLRIQRNVDWLVDNRVPRNGPLRGWGYGEKSPGGDNSNTQYALLGLWAGKQAGAKIDREVWVSIHDYYMRTQQQDGAAKGGWSYSERDTTVSLTMSVAGLCGLIISGQQLNDRRLKIQDDGKVLGCGEDYDDDPTMARALGFLNRNFKIQSPKMRGFLFYHLYGLERAGRLTGRRFLGDYDWYREGCKFLTEKGMQAADGSWSFPGETFDSWPVISSSFALLFLSKGRTPVLISKLTHGPVDDMGTDWNAHRDDARHLTDYAKTNLFKRQPLAWQVFNAREAHAQNDEEVRQLTAELLQSPILYITGHHAPVLTGAEKKLLKGYLEQGGFILAEASSPAFDQGFRKLLADDAVLGADGKLEKLRPDHPIWTAYAKILPKDGYPFPLEGVELGCKTVVVYCPRGSLSCLWESGQMDHPRVKEAFELGGNIVAYATGLELPKPKGFEVVVTDQREPAKVLRGFLKVAQLRHDGDWRAAPKAMRNLLAQMREKDGLDVALQTAELYPNDPDILKYKLLYMHGRAEFEFKPKELETLKAALEHGGGLLLADACCGKPGFDKSFRAMVAAMWPDKKLTPIPATDDLYSKDLNGAAIQSVRCRREPANAGAGDNGYREAPPTLEGIKIENRWVVIYSKFDLGCALEKHQSSDCLGHDPASAMLLGGAVVRYALMR